MNFGKILARGLLQLGVGGPQLRNNAGVIEARNPGNTDYASFRAQTVRIGSTLITHSPTMPVSPTPGDMWMELNGSGVPFYSWYWMWSGSYWLSPLQSERVSFDGLTTVSRIHFVGSHESNLDYLFSSITWNVTVATTNNSSNQWSLQFERVATNGTITNIGPAVDTGVLGLNYGNLAANLASTHVDISTVDAKMFRGVLRKPSGNAGPIYGCAELFFNYARP